MKMLFVEDYNDFACIGGACEISCCSGGWSILVDERSVERYCCVEEDFGEDLQAGLLETDGKHFFRLDQYGSCVFLNERKLCRIQEWGGAEYLCDTCRNYPRTSYQVGDVQFYYLTNSCPEVTRRILERQHPLQIDFGDTGSSDEIQKEIDWTRFNYAIQAYMTGMNILQACNLPVHIKKRILMTFVFQFEENMLKQKDPSKIIGMFSQSENWKDEREAVGKERNFDVKIKIFSVVFSFMMEKTGMHYMRKEYGELAKQLLSHPHLDVGKLEHAFQYIDSEIVQKEIEELLSYRFFAVFMKGYENTDFFEQLVFECVLCEALIGYIAVIEASYDRVCTREERIIFYTMCARIEHNHVVKKQLENIIKEEGWYLLPNLLKLLS